jgi:UDP:flavonoid glycosyltransferase YjiC (YdhE family)
MSRPGLGPSRPLLLLVNFDHALEPPRPIAPSTRFIGALMPRPAAPLPPELRAWLDGSPEGSLEGRPVAYVSFGASFLAPDAVMPALATALAASRGAVRFLLRVRPPERAALEAALAARGAALAPGDALMLERVPQNDVLGHPAVAVFVTQGGYLSMQEAAYHGVPVGGGGGRPGWGRRAGRRGGA